MRIAAIVSNLVLFVFTCFVLLTEGVSTEFPHSILTFLLLSVPILSSMVIHRSRKTGASQASPDERSEASTVADRAAVVANLLLVGFAGWAFLAQYPHPKEEGMVAVASLALFTVLIFFTPIFSILVLIGSAKAKRQWQQDPAA